MKRRMKKRRSPLEMTDSEMEKLLADLAARGIRLVQGGPSGWY